MSDPNIEIMRAMAAQYPDDPAVQELLGTAERVVNKARLERIATAVLASLVGQRDSWRARWECDDAETAVRAARSLIAAIDAEEKKP